MCEKNCMDEKLSNEMKELLKNYSQDKSNLIQILNEVQESMVIFQNNHKLKFLIIYQFQWQKFMVS